MNHNKNAITLTELLVATVVLAIIAMGAISVDLAMRQIYTGTSRNGIIAIRASAIMAHMTKHISQATGTLIDPGVVVAGVNTSPLWFRIDTLQTPWTTADDDWFCYDQSGNDIRYCQVADTTETCTTTTFPATVETIGSVTTAPVNGFQPNFVIDDTDPNDLEFYVEVFLVNRFDNAQAADIHNNPEYELISRISMLSYGQ